MALAPEWMSYTKDVSSSQGSRYLGKERERGAPKYGRQLSHNNLSYLPPSSSYSHLPPPHSLPFACSVSSPPAPPHAPSILGDPPSRVLNRSKSSPGFGSPKNPNGKPKKSPDRNFPSYKQPKPKPPKPSFNPSYYGKSVSQPNLFNNDKTANWHQQKLQQSPSASSIPSTPSPLATSHTISSPPLQPPSTSPPPTPTSPSPPPALVPEIDKLKQLIPTTGMPPKSVRVRGVVGPPLPLTKKPPPSISSVAPASPLQPSPSTSAIGAPPAALASYFRKATSEPSLMHHKAQGVPGSEPAHPVRNVASKKARAMETEKAQIQLLKEAVSARQPKRSNFFQHLIKKEEQGEPLLEDDSPIGVEAEEIAVEAVEERRRRKPGFPSPSLVVL
eukprot:Phypoly_transcript_04802.p1 GENE.Phypoly_transcript_04802~~Phypoly_transcript_04802.p1  ORF type:complete len:388 (+),score=105.73 Phypoly_transcript_04802:258-1421(+)